MKTIYLTFYIFFIILLSCDDQKNYILEEPKSINTEGPKNFIEAKKFFKKEKNISEYDFYFFNKLDRIEGIWLQPESNQMRLIIKVMDDVKIENKDKTQNLYEYWNVNLGTLYKNYNLSSVNERDLFFKTQKKYILNEPVIKLTKNNETRWILNGSVFFDHLATIGGSINEIINVHMNYCWDKNNCKKEKQTMIKIWPPSKSCHYKFFDKVGITNFRYSHPSSLLSLYGKIDFSKSIVMSNFFAIEHFYKSNEYGQKIKNEMLQSSEMYRYSKKEWDGFNSAIVWKIMKEDRSIGTVIALLKDDKDFSEYEMSFSFYGEEIKNFKNLRDWWFNGKSIKHRAFCNFVEIDKYKF